ncbi:MAG: hypothetical protein Greene041619_645 [Candidatus Peregrinibacteria bacterium Greene0416_19]|nr:MAG: hypothetical protein Greene041619_645 [Candidatus Peregrinibacteria bacterium Greene0416_19]
MRKFSLLLGALGGAMAGYLLSNEKLRNELAKAKKPEDAARVLGKYLQKDGSKVVKDVQAFVQSDDVQQNLQKARQFAQGRFREAKQGFREIVTRGEKVVGRGAQSMAKMAKKPFDSASIRPVFAKATPGKQAQDRQGKGGKKTAAKKGGFTEKNV